MSGHPNYNQFDVERLTTELGTHYAARRNYIDAGGTIHPVEPDAPLEDEHFWSLYLWDAQNEIWVWCHDFATRDSLKHHLSILAHGTKNDPMISSNGGRESTSHD